MQYLMGILYILLGLDVIYISKWLGVFDSSEDTYYSLDTGIVLAILTIGMLVLIFKVTGKRVD